MPVTSKWLIERDSSNPYGVVSTQRPSTDAMTALSCWQDGLQTREFEKILDTDASMHVLLRSEDSDGEAGLDLDRCCAKYGVKPVCLD